jgi:hypothetical protein
MVKQLTTQVRTKEGRKEEEQEEEETLFCPAVSSSFPSIELQKTALRTNIKDRKL